MLWIFGIVVLGLGFWYFFMSTPTVKFSQISSKDINSFVSYPQGPVPAGSPVKKALFFGCDYKNDPANQLYGKHCSS